MPQRRKRPRKPFQIKGRQGWFGEYKFADGSVRRVQRDTEEEASVWLAEQVKLDDEEQGPLFGGPTRLTLGRFLGEYAARFSIAKQGYTSEIDRINHYVTAAGLPRLKVVVEPNGNRRLTTTALEKQAPVAFQQHLQARLAQRAQTYAWIATLAKKRVAEVSTDDIRRLVTLGTCEQWGASTIQKEVALLKSAFNSAIREWRWNGFTNPCIGVKLGKSNTRFVVVTEAQMQRLTQVLSECDNRQFWPLVDLAIHSTLRRDSLLSLRWSQIDLESRTARVWGKGKWLDAQLPPRAVAVLRALPRGESDKVFTMTKNAVNMAWEGVRDKAQLPGLTFRDLRHIGATAYAKAGMSAHGLKNLLGHTSTRMAEHYVNLANSDIRAMLDEFDKRLASLTPMPETKHANGKRRHARARKPKAVATNVFHLVQRKDRKLALERIDAAGRPLQVVGAK